MAGETTGGVRWILRLEGLGVLLAAALFYQHLEASWWTFALFFLAPDLSLLAYLGGPRAGALGYNLAHSYGGALVCLLVGSLLSSPALLCAGCIWVAHIGFDRALGYGLKYSAGFRFTHLGVIGKVQ